MILHRDNVEIFAARHYLNEVCLTTDEFEEDLKLFSMIRKAVRKILRGKSENIRLLTNHVICCMNVFELQAAKEILLLDATQEERDSMKTIFNYFGYLSKNEMITDKFCLKIAKLLKDMDK